MLSAGGSLAPNRDMPFMVLLHTSWLVYCIIIAFKSTSSDIDLKVFVSFILLFLGGQTLRVLAIRTLKERWCVKVIALPKLKPVKVGVFRYIRHPNYLGVIMEIFALPLIIGDTLGALIFSFLNGVLLFYRIRAEEQFLQQTMNYNQEMASKSRFVPRFL